MSILFALSTDPIDAAALVAAVPCSRDGAVVSFAGVVRDHNDGLAVSALSYTAYEELARSEGETIVAEAIERFDVGDIRCVHRIGDLVVGDIAVVVAVAAAHRGPAFDACRHVIDEVKRRVPIWKKERAATGAGDDTERWVYPPEAQP